MSTTGASANEGARGRALPAPDGRVTSVAAVAVAAAIVVAAGTSSQLFIAAVVLGLAIASYGALRWPLPTLVVAVIATLADSQITPRLLSGLDLGPIGASEPLLVVVGVALGGRALARGTLGSALTDPVLPLVGLFIGLAVLSAFVNATPPVVALLGLVMTLDAIAIYFVGRTVEVDERAGITAVGAIVGVAVAMAILGIAQMLVAPTILGFSRMTGQFGEGGRITSFMGNPNMVAAVIGVTLPFALYGSRHLTGARWRWAARLALFLLLLALLLTFSRGGWFAVAIGSVVGVLLLDWRSLPVLLAAVVLAWGTATVMPHDLAVSAEPGGDGGGGAGGGVTPPSIIDSTVDRIGNLSDRNDTRGRFLRDGARIVSDNLLLGVGPGRYGGAAAYLIRSPVYEEYDATLFVYRTVHNFWLHLAGEGGALGLSVFLAILAGLVLRFVHAARAASGARFVILAGAATMILVTGLNSLTEMIYEGNMPAILIWFLLGLASLMAPVVPILARRPAAAAVAA